MKTNTIKAIIFALTTAISFGATAAMFENTLKEKTHQKKQFFCVQCKQEIREPHPENYFPSGGWRCIRCKQLVNNGLLSWKEKGLLILNFFKANDSQRITLIKNDHTIIKLIRELKKIPPHYYGINLCITGSVNMNLWLDNYAKLLIKEKAFVTSEPFKKTITAFYWSSNERKRDMLTHDPKLKARLSFSYKNANKFDIPLDTRIMLSDIDEWLKTLK